MKKLMLIISVIMISVCVVYVVPTDVKASETTIISASYKTLSYGAKGTAVKNLQKRLAELGYYSGNIDGKYGPLTKSAVKNFQKTTGLKVNGTANVSTQTALYDDNALLNPKGISYSVKYNDNAVYYDIALSNKKQDYVRQMCKKYNVSFEMVLALMKVESGYKENAKSKTNDYGIMQINKCNHEWLSEALGITDFLDPYQNVMAGTYKFYLLFNEYGDDTAKVLMAYNMGDTGAGRLWDKGIYESRYSREIMQQIAEWKDGV